MALKGRKEGNPIVKFKLMHFYVAVSLLAILYVIFYSIFLNVDSTSEKDKVIFEEDLNAEERYHFGLKNSGVSSKAEPKQKKEEAISQSATETPTTKIPTSAFLPQESNKITQNALKETKLNATLIPKHTRHKFQKFDYFLVSGVKENLGSLMFECL